MSRAPINAAVSELERQMDVMTIDPSCLRIPYKSKKSVSSPPVNHYPVISLVHENNSQHQHQASGSVSIEIKRVEPVISDVNPDHPPISIPGWFIITGYTFFSLSLALCNLFLKPSATSPVCILASPVAMLSLFAHALSVQPLFMGVGLLGSAWVLPSVCAIWSAEVGLYYIAFVGFSLGLAHWRLSALAFLVPLMVCLFLSSPFMVVYHGVESHWGISISVFLVTFFGVFSSRHLTRVTFKIRPLL